MAKELSQKELKTKFLCHYSNLLTAFSDSINYITSLEQKIAQEDSAEVLFNARIYLTKERFIDSLHKVISDLNFLEKYGDLIFDTETAYVPDILLSLFQNNH